MWKLFRNVRIDNLIYIHALVYGSGNLRTLNCFLTIKCLYYVIYIIY